MYCILNDCFIDDVIVCFDIELGVGVCENCPYCVPKNFIPLYPEENPKLAMLHNS